MDNISILHFCSYWSGVNRKVIKRYTFFFFSWSILLFCFLKAKIIQISLITRELVTAPNILRQSSWISVMIFNFRLLKWTALPERVTQQGIIDVGLSDHQLIFCTRKISRIKRGTHKHIKFRSFKHCSADFFKETLTRIDFPNYQNLMTLRKRMIR